DECQKLFEKKRVTSYDQVDVKTIVAGGLGCRACELNIKENFFPEELDESRSPNFPLSRKRPGIDMRSIITDTKAAAYKWIDSHAPSKQRTFLEGFPFLVSNRIRTHFRIMNVPYPVGDLPIADQNIDFKLYSAGGNLLAERWFELACGQVHTYDLAELSGFDPSSTELQFGYCLVKLTPKALCYYGSMRGYFEFRTPNHAASVHVANFRMKSMRFFLYRSKVAKGRHYIVLHNHGAKQASLDAYLCDLKGNVITAGMFELPGLGTGMYSLEDMFPRLPTADAERGGLIQVKSTESTASFSLFWDSDSGQIAVNHH
ncbi:MAG: hypothetical protein QGF68_15885, partial [Nitrospinota bacterium]|nr:hypothetical protein [Nitrospinota bacterium]